MEDGVPSGTALLTAHARALHQSEDEPLILVDPLAQRIVDASEAAAPTVDEVALTRSRRLFFASRARFAQDRIEAAYAEGTRQVVILGAGLDTFAYRNAHDGLRVFEVDHPATQRWKRSLLTAAGIDIPESATLVGVDFENQRLDIELEAAEFDRTQSTVFAWLGVIFYLTVEAIEDTLAFMAGQAGAVEVVFDYLRTGETAQQRADMRERSARLKGVGEPFLSFFTPQELDARLHERGFVVVEDLGGAELIAGYLPPQSSDDAEFASLRSSRLLWARSTH